ncbi:MAG: ATP-dependent protease La, ATP-dependent Lon protease [Microgenomates group bacterium GW2011_GWC1_39_7b]|uniref:Lon protease n=3 Tax=Candidatus Woeseibacteriota TaxID=1752722 RepID=A0A0G0LJM1_9BACT|nr:MAG: Lon protease [Candidatus Woesebacteria bacterium GW2011_GWB1_39_10]KKR26100.1 MAG: ATP-dependent protease La, ATP-dependent Lon protease [Microgenomates group bacterium GW2011_GWC1_39_7b]KKR73508.1 MAG: Lon protease [Candidatus Woesebacteria bacterium GW2011_GWA2_40_7]KKS91048.1 MAG: Lon protease [Candidatus Woesebacteria bacterium GW2011_GWA1_43_12]
MEPAAQEITVLIERIKNASLPDKLREMVLVRLNQLAKLTNSPSFLPEFDSMEKYIDWITILPWNKRIQDTLDLENAKKILEAHHYGLDDIKTRVLEYMSVMKLKTEKGEMKDLYRAPILCFVGLVGTGKTTIAYSIAEALGRPIARIPFGGMGDPLDLRGQSRMHPEAEPGKVIKALRDTQCRNPVILLDEIDRVTEQGRSSIMGVLVELLDPKQNYAYVDHYIDFPFDLSETLFIATANNTTSIATAVMDRLEPISMPSYSDQEKTVIAQRYILPAAMKASGLPEGSLVISDEVWPNIVRPLGYDAGIRTLERNIDGVVRKVARMIVEGKAKEVRVTSENVKTFIPQ